jgi:putative endonuclease
VVEHNSHALLAARYTRSRRPVVLVYSESAATRSAAARREYRIKQETRSGKEALIAAALPLRRKRRDERRKTKGMRDEG